MEQKSTIYSVCYMSAKSKEEADNLFQESLINLWQGFGMLLLVRKRILRQS